MREIAKRESHRHTWIFLGTIDWKDFFSGLPTPHSLMRERSASASGVVDQGTTELQQRIAMHIGLTVLLYMGISKSNTDQ